MCDRIVGLKEVHLETVNIFHYSQKHLGYIFLYTKLTSTVYCFSENYVSNSPPRPMRDVLFSSWGLFLLLKYCCYDVMVWENN